MRAEESGHHRADYQAPSRQSGREGRITHTARYVWPVGGTVVTGGAEVGESGRGTPRGLLTPAVGGGVGPGPPYALPPVPVSVAARLAIQPETTPGSDPTRRAPTNAATVAPATDSARPTNELARPWTFSSAKIPTPNPISASTGILITPSVVPPDCAASTKSRSGCTTARLTTMPTIACASRMTSDAWSIACSHSKANDCVERWPRNANESGATSVARTSVTSAMKTRKS